MKWEMEKLRIMGYLKTAYKTLAILTTSSQKHNGDFHLQMHTFKNTIMISLNCSKQEFFMIEGLPYKIWQFVVTWQLAGDFLWRKP